MKNKTPQLSEKEVDALRILTCAEYKTLQLSEKEVDVLHILLCAEYKIYLDRVAHAASHGQEYSDRYGEALGRIVKKLQ